VVGVYEGGKLSPAAMKLDSVSGQALGEALSRGDIDGELGTALLLAKVANVAAERVLLVGLGERGKFAVPQYLKAIADGVRAIAALPDPVG
jgi:leucyl aminopeptidase